MAHKGKFYPVAFRRDFQLNVSNYSVGYANRYKVVPHGQTTGPGTLLFNVPFDCGPPFIHNFSQRSWLSQVEHILVFDFQVECFQEIVPGGQFETTLINFYELNVGLIATVQRGGGQRRVGGFASGPRDSTIQWDQAWFDRYPFLELTTSVPKTWKDPPPH